MGRNLHASGTPTGLVREGVGHTVVLSLVSNDGSVLTPCPSSCMMCFDR